MKSPGEPQHEMACVGLDSFAAILDSDAAFSQRATQFGLSPEVLKTLTDQGFTSHGKLALQLAGTHPPPRMPMSFLGLRNCWAENQKDMKWLVCAACSLRAIHWL